MKNNLNDMFNKFQEEIKLKAEKELKPLLEEKLISLMIDDFVELKFEAYTPYFADGDECIYEVFSIMVKLIEKESEDYEDNNGFTHFEDIIDQKSKAKAESINDIVQQDIDPKIFKLVYGDHKSIYITKNDVIVKNNTKHD